MSLFIDRIEEQSRTVDANGLEYQIVEVILENNFGEVASQQDAQNWASLYADPDRDNIYFLHPNGMENNIANTLFSSLTDGMTVIKYSGLPYRLLPIISTVKIVIILRP